MRSAWMGTAGALLILLFGAWGAGGAVPGLAPDLPSSSLDLVEELMGESRYVEARGVLLDWWDDRAATAPRSDLQRALWLRAILTVDPTLAERDFRRLAIEFPGGPWSDEALMRLARIAELRGNLSAAREHLDVLIRDHPGSPLRPEARALRERLAREPGSGL